jgi:hypothetical protein
VTVDGTGRSWRAGGLLAVAGLLLAFLSSSPTSGSGPRVLHIHHGLDVATPAQIGQNAALIDSRPMDGVTVLLPGLSHHTVTATAHSPAEYVRALEPMPNLRHVVHNFVLVRMTDPMSWTDDRAWRTAARNLAGAAAAARAEGQFDGIFLDTEYYGRGEWPWDFGTGQRAWRSSRVAGATPGLSPDQASALVAARGRQVAAAVAAAWPHAVVVTTYGPWVGESKTATIGGWSAFGYNDIAWRNELMGSFVGGLAEEVGAHTSMTYVDGGEVYQARTADDFATAQRWMRTGLASSGSRVLRHPSTYAKRMSVGFGVYDRDIRAHGWPAMTPVQWQSALTNALNKADRYVWSYSEVYNWVGTSRPSQPVPPTILVATALARKLAR